jgi:tripartite-type tricarboxylate transporter receptor subunit TctC
MKHGTKRSTDPRRRSALAGLAALATLPAGVRAQPAAGGAASPAPAGATGYPSRQIRLVIAFPPGGPTDIVSRVFAQRLSEQLGQTVFVDNKPGAGGNIAAEFVAKALPDGYTLFYNTSAITIAPALYGKVPYDTLKDFEPISTTAAVPMVLMVNPAVPARTVREFIDYAKAHPGQLNYASSGTGTITHLAMAALAAHAGLQMQHVPYKGSAPAMTELAGGTTQAMIDTLNSSIPYLRDGRVRALAVTTAKRSSVAPELPTLAETEMPGMEMSAWQGIVAPAGTPRAIVERMNAEVLKAIQSADVRGKLSAQGTEPLGSSPEQYAAYIRTELARWSRIVRDSGAKVD